MSTASRHAGAPYVDGETLAGADLEADIANVYAVVNGDIDNGNIAAAAGIAGSKLADASIANAKLADDTITTDKMAAGAVVQAYVSSSTASGNMTSATTYQDVSGITQASLTPGSTSDIIFLDFGCQMAAGISTTTVYDWSFSVNGTDVSEPMILAIPISDKFVHYTYAVAAPATTTMVLKPRHKQNAAGSPGTFPATVTRVFRALIIPAKS